MLQHNIRPIYQYNIQIFLTLWAPQRTPPFTAPVIISWLLDAAMQRALQGGWALWCADPGGVGVILHPQSCMGNGGRWTLLNPGCVTAAALWMDYLFYSAECLNISVTQAILEAPCVYTTVWYRPGRTNYFSAVGCHFSASNPLYTNTSFWQ